MEDEIILTARAKQSSNDNHRTNVTKGISSEPYGDHEDQVKELPQNRTCGSDDRSLTWVFSSVSFSLEEVVGDWGRKCVTRWFCLSFWGDEARMHA
eukprot:3890780-Amphidinium_carterae.1